MHANIFDQKKKKKEKSNLFRCSSEALSQPEGAKPLRKEKAQCHGQAAKKKTIQIRNTYKKSTRTLTTSQIKTVKKKLRYQFKD